MIFESDFYPVRVHSARAVVAAPPHGTPSAPTAATATALGMRFDPNGNTIEQCGDKCLSVRFANDSGRAAAIDVPAPVLCGFGCGAYGDPARGGMCVSCIRSKGFEKEFPAAAAPSGEESKSTLVEPGSGVNEGCNAK